MSARAKFVYVVPVALALIIAFVFPFVADAATTGVKSNVWDPRILGGPLVICTGDGVGRDMVPCESLCDLVGQIAHVVYYFIAVVIWVIAPIMIAWTGLSLLMSQGSAEAMSHAKGRLGRVVIGLLIVLCGYLIIATFLNVFGITGVGGFGGTSACSIQ